MLVSPVQPEKAKEPMLVTLSGIVTLTSPVQREKAESPMLVTLSGISMLVNPVQPEKAFSPILVTLFGIVMFVRFVQPEKAQLPMPVTGFDLYSDGIIISASVQELISTMLYPCSSSFNKNFIPLYSSILFFSPWSTLLLSGVLPQATRAHDKTSAIVRMARTKMILFLLDFITNLAKIYCRASKKSKKYNKFSPLILPQTTYFKKEDNECKKYYYGNSTFVFKIGF